MGHRDWARPELENLVQVEPKVAAYRYWLARIDYDDRRYPDAVALLQQLAAEAPGVKVFDNLALSLEGTGALTEAAEIYLKAVSLNRALPKPSPWPPLNYGTLLSRREQYSEAEMLLSEARGYDATLPEVHFRLGVVYDKQGQTERAVQELTKAAELGPHYSDPLYALSRIYYRQGNRQLAQATLDRFNRLRAAERVTQ
jgi:tetratricopeptide (TPR) repeat protein